MHVIDAEMVLGGVLLISAVGGGEDGGEGVQGIFIRWFASQATLVFMFQA